MKSKEVLIFGIIALFILFTIFLFHRQIVFPYSAFIVIGYGISCLYCGYYQAKKEFKKKQQKQRK